MTVAYKLILLRHGESVWNATNQFTGWVDVPLSEKGTAEAIRGGALLTEAGVLPDVLHTSLLRRAITTANLALDDNVCLVNLRQLEVTREVLHRARHERTGTQKVRIDRSV